MRRDQSEASLSHHLFMSNTPRAHYALRSRNDVEPRHGQFKLDELPGQDSRRLEAESPTDKPTFGAEEQDPVQSHRENHNAPSAQVNEARCVTSEASYHEPWPPVHFPTGLESTDQQMNRPIGNLSCDTQAGALESIGSHLVSHKVGFAEFPSAGDAPEAGSSASDTEMYDSVSKSHTVSLRCSLHQTDYYTENKSQRRSSRSAAAHDAEGHDDDRLYTRLLGDSSLLSVPIGTNRPGSRPQSVITDAGDQAELNHRLGHPSSRGSSISSEPSLADEDFTSPHQLQGDILETYKRTRDNQRFLPKGDIYRLVTPESVYRELSRVLGDLHPPAHVQAWATKICTETKTNQHGKPKFKSFRKVFALLVIVESSATIPWFLDEDVSDIDLPLVPIRGIGGHGIKGFSRKGSTNPLSCFRRWSPTRLDTFYDHQWRMLAVYFAQSNSGLVKHYQLQDQHILPFVASSNRDEDYKEIRGGYSRVFMVHIHEDHHDFPQVSSQINDKGFAIKQLLRGSDWQAFEREAKILRIFSGTKSHPHIISLLATYELGGAYHLLFYRAESDLLSLWKELEPEPKFDYANILWMAEQCFGIADGLHRLHKSLTFNVKQDARAGPQLVSEGASSRKSSTTSPWIAVELSDEQLLSPDNLFLLCTPLNRLS